MRLSARASVGPHRHRDRRRRRRHQPRQVRQGERHPQGLMPEDAQLSDDEIDNLIFLPGFSTATVVSNISGRGVGMDVVKRSIQALGGRISIRRGPARARLSP